ncbi:MAG: extracellular solute-binding protein [Chloroflexota bacterium]|nr:extracellular solute-binding protein [Chloroflexota bacterium]
MTRRQVLRLAGFLGVGTLGTAALSGCVESGQGGVQASRSSSDKPPASPYVSISFSSTHHAGPRGAAMEWGLRRFAERRPDIYVEFEPDVNLVGRLLADTAPHVAHTPQGAFLSFLVEGAFVEVTDILEQMDVRKEDYYFLPDTHTDNGLDHSYPPPRQMRGPQFGMPFQFEISGFVANLSLAENAGVRFPDSEASWTWADWTEWDAQMTEPDVGTYGTWARQDYQYQYLPQMYSNGLKKPFDDGLTRTMFDEPQALEAWEYLINKIFVHQTSPAPHQIRTISGEYGEPFAAGKIGIWPSGRAFSTGYGDGVIRDRFTWTLLPAVVAERGGPPGHSASEVPNLITRSASRDGLEEPALALAVFFAGEEFQGRVGIERGHMPVHTRALEAPESLAPPPHGMKWLKMYADRTDNRGPYPFGTWREWFIQHQRIGLSGWLGRQTPGESLRAVQDWGVRHLSEYDGPKPFVDSPVYP